MIIGARAVIHLVVIAIILDLSPRSVNFSVILNLDIFWKLTSGNDNWIFIVDQLHILKCNILDCTLTARPGFDSMQLMTLG